MSRVLREGLLAGRAVALAAGPSRSVEDRLAVGEARAPALEARLAALGARVEMVPLDLDGTDEEKVGEWARSRGPLHALVYDAGTDELDAVLARGWAAVREVAVGALIPAETEGKIVLIGPAGQAPVVAALENVARTLSVEWARYRVTVVAVAAGPGARDEEVAEIVCYLVSPAGDYFSGARFDVGLVARDG